MNIDMKSVNAIRVCQQTRFRKQIPDTRDFR